MDETKRIELTEKPRACPLCGHKKIARILYGLPRFDDRLEKELGAGTVTLGGCGITDDDPGWECDNCGQKFHRKKA